MNIDDYSEVKNGEETYEEIADMLSIGSSCIIGWTDENGTHFDILFTLRPIQFGMLQGGIRGRTDLFVSIMRRGAFGFDINTEREIHYNYISEKLGRGMGETAEKLAELINNVIKKINLSSL